MIAATTDIADEYDEAQGRAKARKAHRVPEPQRVEIVLTLNLQMHPSMQQFALPQQIQVPVSVPVESHAPMQQQIVPHYVVTQQPTVEAPTVTTTQRVPEVMPERAPDPVPLPSLVELYKEHLAPREMEKGNEPRTVRADISRIQKFQDWLDAGALRNTTPQRAYLQCFGESKDLLSDYSRFIRSQDVGNSSATVSQALNAIMKLARWAFENGQLAKVPKYPTKGDVNVMRLQEDDSDFRAEPVTVEELRRMLSPEVLDACDWPRLGNVPPAKFWETVLLSHYCLGFRTQDWFASRTTGKTGLMWSDVLSDTQCPRLKDLHNEHGWAWYIVHKTKKKSQRAAKPVKLLVPLSQKLRERIELFRGIHPERVFPLPCNGRYWASAVQGILLRAGLDDASRIAAKKPCIELSLGQKAVASFRKGCADMWAGHVDEAAASYLLQHSVSDGKVSAVTLEHYLRVYRPLRDIVPALETLPIW